MKNWLRTLTAKNVCFILCVACLCVTVLSVIGAVFFISGELYVLPKSYVLETVFEQNLRNDSNNILWLHIPDDGYQYYHVNDYDVYVTNIRYCVVSEDGEVIGANSENEEFDYSFKWIFHKNADGEYSEIDYYFDGAEKLENADIFTVNMSVDRSFPVHDEFFFWNLIINIAYALLYWIYPIGLLSLALCVACFIILMCTAGRRPESEEVHPGLFTAIPIDLFILILSGGVMLLFYLLWDVWYTGELVASILTVVLVLSAANVLLGLCISIATRIKLKKLFSNTLVWIVLKLIFKLFRRIFFCIRALVRSVPLIWKTLLFLGANIFTDGLLLTMAYSWDEAAFFLWGFKTLIVLPVLLYAAIVLRRLEKGGRKIAEGDLSHRIDTKRMLWNFKKHGENLNSISRGMSNAVEKRLQSERMKTELITNVSHDIKTPLTSIINYSRLIAESECDCDRHREYSEVLLRKSEHLKRLLDDLIEMSKATTGNLDVDMSPCDATVLISQAEGEFREKCESASLSFLCSFPEAPLYIMADPRRIWRVFENLMSNACKYSLPHSRVYLSLEKDGDDAVFIFRNTSKEPINVTAEELTQRFVRGDSSRTTEGSGLGLSIAKSLTELQGGRMDITVDGDLFKVTLRFPNV